MDTYTYEIQKSDPQYASPYLGVLYRNKVEVYWVFGHSKRKLKERLKTQADRCRDGGPKVVDSGTL